jgi:hypothetical protein
VDVQQDVWQMRRSDADAKENFGANRIAHLDETTSRGIQLSVHANGVFHVVNGQPGEVRIYPAR